MMSNFHGKMMNIQGRPASLIIGDVTSWNEGHKHARHKAAEIACAADAEIKMLRGFLSEIVDNESVAPYPSAIESCSPDCLDFEDWAKRVRIHLRDVFR